MASNAEEILDRMIVPVRNVHELRNLSTVIQIRMKVAKWTRRERDHGIRVMYRVEPEMNYGIEFLLSEFTDKGLLIDVRRSSDGLCELIFRKSEAVTEPLEMATLFSADDPTQPDLGVPVVIDVFDFPIDVVAPPPAPAPTAEALHMATHPGTFSKVLAVARTNASTLIPVTYADRALIVLLFLIAIFTSSRACGL